MTESVLQGAVLGLAGSFEDSAVGVEEPTVIATTDAPLLDLPVLKGSAPVRTMRLDYSDSAIAVPKRDQLLAKPGDGYGKVSYLFT